MKSIIFVVLICLLLCSCGIFRSKNKNINKDLSTIESLVNTKKDSVYEKVDKSVINTKTTSHGLIDIPGATFKDRRAFNGADWMNGVTLIDNDLYTVKQNLDSLNGHLTTLVVKKPNRLPIDYSRETTTYNNIIETGKFTQTLDRKDNEKTESFSKNKISEPAKIGNLTIIALGSVLIICILVFLFFKSKKP